MKIKSNFLYVLLITTIITFICLGTYVFESYTILNNNITSVEILLNKDLDPESVPLIYAVKGKSNKIDFDSPHQFINTKDSTYISVFDGVSKLRVIRLYFDKYSKNLDIYSVKIKSKNEIKEINLSEVKTQRLKLNEIKNKYSITLQDKHSFIELPKTFIYTSDFINLYLLILPLIILLISIVLIVKKMKLNELKLPKTRRLILPFFILTIFLPAPTYNIALILMAMLNFKNISWLVIKSKKINLLILGFFIFYSLNNFLISEEGVRDLSTIERFLPFFILGIVLPSISERRNLVWFPVSAFLIGFWLLLTSIFDVYIHQNLEFISFDYFSKYLHPVYFSYLLFFSICYVNLNYHGKQKYILELFLFIFLIFSGSKMVLLLSLILISIEIFNSKRALVIIFPIAIITVLFSPLKKRFSDILKIEDMSILKENTIKNANDSRINGLTLRLILWREALETMKGIDYVLGKGVTKQTNLKLRNEMSNIGLIEHKNLNPHNQYVDTFWRTGLIGLILLILIPAFSFITGLKNKDKLLVQFSLFMFVVMWSESIFGRVNGIYFFTTVLLILMNSNTINENSHIRN